MLSFDSEAKACPATKVKARDPRVYKDTTGALLSVLTPTLIASQLRLSIFISHSKVQRR